MNQEFYSIKTSEYYTIHIPTESLKIMYDLWQADFVDSSVTSWEDENHVYHLAYHVGIIGENDKYTIEVCTPTNENGVDGRTIVIHEVAIETMELVFKSLDKEETMTETKAVPNAVEFLKKELAYFGVAHSRVYTSGLSDENAVAELAVGEAGPNEPLILELYCGGRHTINSHSFNFYDWEDTICYAQLIQKAVGIAIKWQALHTTDESLDGKDNS